MRANASVILVEGDLNDEQETCYLFKELNIDSQDLSFIDEVDLVQQCENDGGSIVLVDHNRLAESQQVGSTRT